VGTQEDRNLAAMYGRVEVVAHVSVHWFDMGCGSLLRWWRPILDFEQKIVMLWPSG
jgi:hypothetical protein